MFGITPERTRSRRFFALLIRGFLSPKSGIRQLACVAARGFALLPGNSQLDYLSAPLSDDITPYTRFNDGGCDSRGRFFAGTICNQDHGIPGRLYKFDPTVGSCGIVDEGPFTVRRWPGPDCHGLTQCRTQTDLAGARTKRHCKNVPVLQSHIS
jgi:hypothetical protein